MISRLRNCSLGFDTHRLVVKNLSGTRWSARADATRAVVSHYKEIRAALLEICTNQDQSLETKVEADGLANKMGQLKLQYDGSNLVYNF